jgi:4-hydroxybenzoate polyprenyltransferase
MKIISIIEKRIRSIEESKIPFIYFICTFCSAVILRNLLESFSTGTPVSFDTFTHFSLFYICLALTFILLFSSVLGQRAEKAARIILPSFLILILPPIVDLIISSGQGYSMTYLFPKKHGNLVERFFTLTGEFSGFGLTPGIKTEIGIVFFASFIYFYIKTSRFLKSFILVVLEYSIFFLYSIVPFYIKWFYGFFEKTHSYSGKDFVFFYLILILLQGIPLAYLSNRNHFRVIVGDMRPFRVLHYILMFVLGVILGLKSEMFTLTFQSSFHFIFIPVSIVFASLFSIITNNIADLDIDRVSNRNRPLVKNQIALEDYRRLAWPFLAISLTYAASVSFTSFFLIFLCIGNYFLYSMPPVRFKRVPFFSKLVVSINSLALVLLGFSTVHANRADFPGSLFAIILIGFTAAANFIDLKDYEGDRKTGIRTIPTMLGLRKSKVIIGIFFFLCYLSVHILLNNNSLLVLLILMGAIQFLLINRKNYREKPVFLFHLLSLLLLIVYLAAFPT